MIRSWGIFCASGCYIKSMLKLCDFIEKGHIKCYNTKWITVMLGGGKMARKLREKSSTGIYHTVLRGQKRLFVKEEDYSEFIGTMERYFDGRNSKLYAYSIEKNKVHLVLFTSGDIKDVMKPFLTSYARYVNRTYKKTGKLFYDRYISVPIEDRDTLKKAVIFVNEKPKADRTSKEEYMNADGVCDISDFDESDIEEIRNPAVIYPFTDDYAAMTDSELKRNLMMITKEKTDMPELCRLAVKYSNLSMARVSRVLNVPGAKRQKTVKKEEEKIQKKQELSVWLL